MPTITIQPGQPDEGMGYNVAKPLPYPWHIDTESGEVGHQEFWNGEPFRLLGFQKNAQVQMVDLMLDQFVENPNLAVGMYAVFSDKDGGMYNITVPITHVHSVTVKA